MLLDPYNVNILGSSNIKFLTFFYPIIYDITRSSNLCVPGGEAFSKTRICRNPTTLLLISHSNKISHLSLPRWQFNILTFGF